LRSLTFFTLQGMARGAEAAEAAWEHAASRVRNDIGA
jgi:hypothetical protein